jgi:hypothetical protein
MAEVARALGALALLAWSFGIWSWRAFEASADSGLTLFIERARAAGRTQKLPFDALASGDVKGAFESIERPVAVVFLFLVGAAALGLLIHARSAPKRMVALASIGAACGVTTLVRALASEDGPWGLVPPDESGVVILGAALVPFGLAAFACRALVRGRAWSSLPLGAIVVVALLVAFLPRLHPTVGIAVVHAGWGMRATPVLLATGALVLATKTRERIAFTWIARAVTLAVVILTLTASAFALRGPRTGPRARVLHLIEWDRTHHHEKHLTDLAFSADARTLVTTSANGVRATWAVPGGDLLDESGETIINLAGWDQRHAFAYSPDGKLQARVLATGAIAIERSDATLVREVHLDEVTLPPRVTREIVAIALSSRGDLAVILRLEPWGFPRRLELHPADTR